MMFRDARSPDPLKHIQESEFLDAGPHLMDAFPNNVLFGGAVYSFTCFVEILEDEIFSAVSYFIDSHTAASVVKELTVTRFTRLQHFCRSGCPVINYHRYYYKCAYPY